MAIISPPSLDKVGEALVEANAVVASAVSAGADEQTVEDALVALCRASYDALLEWEIACTQKEVPELADPETWRTPVDELRLQVSLAEMELRDAGVPGVEAAERWTRAVTQRLAVARHDVGEAVDMLRTELRKLVP